MSYIMSASVLLERRLRRRTHHRNWAGLNPDKIRAINNRWYVTHAEERREHRNTRVRTQYRIVQEQIAGRSKPSTCDVCGAGGKLHFDHDHASGQFRGWLCHHCNLALGNVKDSVLCLEQLIAYLRRFTEVAEHEK